MFLSGLWAKGKLSSILVKETSIDSLSTSFNMLQLKNVTTCIVNTLFLYQSRSPCWGGGHVGTFPENLQHFCFQQE